eukprot:TRINITY_DN4352_c0_g1_i1.p1 TRINITY_DN4352_c0_g1~~TRINITY_DN4352_c0_g1_i1.p1  ORF type:complete len:494 (-),score=192.32 TRINITY_DN4352_c0_g1_i1:44-1525(-)
MTRTKKVLALFVVALFVAQLCSSQSNEDPRPYPEDDWGPKRTTQEVLALMRELASADSLSSHEKRVAATNVLFPISTNGKDDDYPDIQHFRIEQTTTRTNRFVSGHLWILNNPLNHFSILPPLTGCGTLVKPSETARAEECIVATNAGFFNTHTYACNGNLVSEGQVIQNTGIQNANFGIRKDGSFQVGYLNMTDVVDPNTQSTFFQDLVAGVVWVVKDGRSYVTDSLTVEDMSTQETGSGFATIQSARNVLGHDDQGRLIIFTADGKSYQRGVDLYDMATILLTFPNLNVINAINLDGGGSAVVVENGTVVSYPSDECPAPNGQYHCERAVTSITCIHRNPRVPSPSPSPAPSATQSPFPSGTPIPTFSSTPFVEPSANPTTQPSATFSPVASETPKASITTFHSFSSTPLPRTSLDGCDDPNKSSDPQSSDNNDGDDNSIYWMLAVGTLVAALLISIVFNVFLGAFIFHSRQKPEGGSPIEFSFSEQLEDF